MSNEKPDLTYQGEFPNLRRRYKPEYVPTPEEAEGDTWIYCFNQPQTVYPMPPQEDLHEHHQ